jgi:hypothetical protein
VVPALSSTALTAEPVPQYSALPEGSVTPFQAAWICFTTGSGIGT